MLQDIMLYLGVDSRAILEIGFFAIMLLFTLVCSFHSSRRAFHRGRLRGEHDERLRSNIENFSQRIARNRNQH